MTDIKDYVCTFEQAKKLRELGIEQSSLFHWSYKPGDYVIKLSSTNLKHIEKDYAAFTSQELEELLLKYCEEELLEQEFVLNIDTSKNNRLYFHFFDKSLDSAHEFESNYKSKAQACADFLIYLIEEINNNWGMRIKQ